MSLQQWESLGTYLNWLFGNMFGEAQPHMHFWMLSIIICVSAFGVVTVRNLIHAAMLMSLTFVGVAGIFILLNAEFLAAVQVFIYAGAIVVLVIFAIMLSENITGKKMVVHNRQSLAAMTVSIVMALTMIGILLYDLDGYFEGPWRWWVTPDRNPFPPEDNSVMIGNSLFSTYTLAFWIASIILMIAMIGSLIIARADSDDHETHTERLIPNGEESAKE